jgi:hypothetical protein
LNNNTNNSNKDNRIQSFRAQSFLKGPIHLITSAVAVVESSKFQQNWIWIVERQNSVGIDFLSDKILTLNYMIHNSTDSELLFLEALSRLSLEKPISFILNLSYRELENYLRDENHLPVFVDSWTNSSEASFKKVKNSLLMELIQKEMDLKFTLEIKNRSWNKLSLVEKNQYSLSLINALNNVFFSMKNIQLVFARNEEVSIIMNDFQLSLDVIEGLFHLNFLGPSENSSLKVVAVQ